MLGLPAERFTDDGLITLAKGCPRLQVGPHACQGCASHDGGTCGTAHASSIGSAGQTEPRLARRRGVLASV